MDVLMKCLMNCQLRVFFILFNLVYSTRVYNMLIIHLKFILRPPRSKVSSTTRADMICCYLIHQKNWKVKRVFQQKLSPIILWHSSGIRRKRRKPIKCFFFHIICIAHDLFSDNFQTVVVTLDTASHQYSLLNLPSLDVALVFLSHFNNWNITRCKRYFIQMIVVHSCVCLCTFYYTFHTEHVWLKILLVCSFNLCVMWYAFRLF